MWPMLQGYGRAGARAMLSVRALPRARVDFTRSPKQVLTSSSWREGDAFAGVSQQGKAEAGCAAWSPVGHQTILKQWTTRFRLLDDRPRKVLI
jgi:hypothetical protein